MAAHVLERRRLIFFRSITLRLLQSDEFEGGSLDHETRRATTDGAGRVWSDVASGDPPQVRLFLLGDTDYGGCCVDEISAHHYNCDLIVLNFRSKILVPIAPLSQY